MPRITKVTTRRGDDGFTDLAGGARVRKDSNRIRAIGTLDELNSALGMARAQKPQPATDRRLREIQNDLLCLGAMLSRKSRARRTSAGPDLDVHLPEVMEQESADLQRQLGPLENFLLPGGTPSAAGLQFARAVCRRAEREVVALSRSETIDPLPGLYLNRLSDLLFQYARLENKAAGFSEHFWNSR
jgi:cob(I)alamin adenosyltransferase